MRFPLIATAALLAAVEAKLPVTKVTITVTAAATVTQTVNGGPPVIHTHTKYVCKKSKTTTTTTCSTAATFTAGGLYNAGPTEVASFCNGAFAVFQDDANFVVYPGEYTATDNGWQTDTSNGEGGCGGENPPCAIAFDASGDFTVQEYGADQFNTNTAPNGANLIISQTNPHAYIEDAGGNIIWQSSD